MSSKFQPDLTPGNFTSGTDGNQKKRETIKEQVMLFLETRCSEKPSSHFPGDSNDINLAQRLYYIFSSKIADYLIRSFVRNSKRKAIDTNSDKWDTNSDKWEWGESDIKIDENALNEARKEYLTRYVYDHEGSMIFLKPNVPMRQADVKKQETFDFLKKMADRLTAITNYNVLKSSDISSDLRKVVVVGIEALMHQLLSDVSYRFKQNVDGTDADYSAETYLSFASETDKIIKNVETMKSAAEADLEKLKSGVPQDAEPKNAVPQEIDDGRARRLIDAVAQMDDMILKLNTIKHNFLQRPNVDRDKNKSTSAPRSSRVDSITIPNSIMKAIYDQLPNFPFPVLKIVEKLDTDDGALQHYITVDGRTISLDYLYNNGFLETKMSKQGKRTVQGVIPWLAYWYADTTKKIKGGMKGNIYSVNVTSRFAEKLIDFCMLNNVVFDFGANSIQYKKLDLEEKENEFDLKIQREPGIVQNMDGALILKLSGDTIKPILANVTGDCKRKLLRYVNINFDRVVNEEGILLF